GNGDGTFQSRALILGEEVFDVEAADFNRDGRTDLALDDGYRIWILLGQGDGAFLPPVMTNVERMPGSNTHYASSGIVVVDFNRDGLPDIATRSNVMLGKGDGSFHAPLFFLEQSTAKGNFPHASAAADLDGDGHQDLVISYNSNFVSVFRGKGDGTMSPSLEFPVGHMYYLVTADLDGDGLPDVATANVRSNDISLLLNRSPRAPGLNRAVSAASGSAKVAPESLATLFVPTPATAAERASPPYPTRLGGINLEVRDSEGAVRLAPLLHVSSTQINFQVPAGTALGEASLAIIDDRGSTSAGGMQVNAVAPGLFMVDHREGTPAAVGVRVASDGSQTPVPVFMCEGLSCRPSVIPLAGDPVYLSFFGTGFRGATSTKVTGSINGVPVPVTYAGPQGTPGLDQIDIQLPPELREAWLGWTGQGWLTLSIDGVVANGALIRFR
ncbi:MAG: FG-GAP-like repeat-containing protein, partial [Gammaproteobacteria bacterium]